MQLVSVLVYLAVCVCDIMCYVMMAVLLGVEQYEERTIYIKI